MLKASLLQCLHKVKKSVSKMCLTSLTRKQQSSLSYEYIYKKLEFFNFQAKIVNH